MTNEQIELEFAHLEFDEKLRNKDKEEYSDPTYDEYERQAEAEDRVSSYEYTPDPTPPARTSLDDNSDDWIEQD